MGDGRSEKRKDRHADCDSGQGGNEGLGDAEGHGDPLLDSVRGNASALMSDEPNALASSIGLVHVLPWKCVHRLYKAWNRFSIGA